MIFNQDVVDVQKYLFYTDSAYSLGIERPVCTIEAKYIFSSGSSPVAFIQSEREVHQFKIDQKRCTRVLLLADSDAHVSVQPGQDFSLISLLRGRNWSTTIVTHDGRARELASNARGATSTDGNRAALVFDNPPRFALLSKTGVVGEQHSMPANAYLQLTRDTIQAIGDGNDVLAFDEAAGEWVPSERRTERPTLDYPGVVTTGGRVSGHNFNVPAGIALLIGDDSGNGGLVIGSGVDQAASVKDRAVLLLRGGRCDLS